MNVIEIRPRGFCPGVYHAIQLVEEAINNPQVRRPITILGMIVHNRHVVDDLARKGVVTLDDPTKTRQELADQIQDGTVIITAHGILPEVISSLQKRGIDVIDASCRDVLRTQQLVKQKLEEGFDVLYLGKEGHPEAESVVLLSDKVHLISSETDLNSLCIKNHNLFVTNQTTFSIRDLASLRSAISIKYPKSVFSDEICDATRMRQEALIKYNQGVDLCLIVGDPRSNNSKNLVKISEQETHTLTYLVGSVEDLKPSMFEGVQTVSVSSGASTPNYLTQSVIDYCRNLN